MSDLHDDVRRNFDGSIDFDFYRRRAARLRQASLREVCARRVRRVVKPALMLALVVIAFSNLPSAEQFERTVRRPGSSPAIAQVADSAQAFRRAAAELLGSVRLRSRAERGPWPDRHP